MSSAPQAPGVERRRQLRLQRRQERLRNVWRLLVFSAAAAGLGYGLLRQGWTLSSPSQVEISGSERVSREQAIAAAELRFPLPLLNLDPRLVRSELLEALPVEQVAVQRLILPPRLRIELVDRKVVARAERRTAKGPEQGYIDRLGHWISSSQQAMGSGATQPETTIRVQGWQDRFRATLVEVMERRDDLGSPLKLIRFEPDGTLWLTTATLGEVKLGEPDGELNRRLDVLRYLSGELPKRVKGQTLRSIDLSDPDQPELGLPAPPAGSTPAKPPGQGVD
ncbi:FtsQ-type POTRA domain-containing protein [Synechococcus sp. BSF8S]|uniref:cell division protein FtsQ/DivIB n=2 Tax=Synechococcales TaxID=1890424 RepID=UPI00162A4870|nr:MULTISPECIES: FtsQ-type POTRA domain-containing protein [unclassified Synechococcus]MBC1261407.1 FtsQ-type POTRA domain-containing protein [Synechococcus sp. BSF8S]MBC1264437.1 FtsQ-type POTRA domain-containing protein [Synechococcus sp. BSA11S]